MNEIINLDRTTTGVTRLEAPATCVREKKQRASVRERRVARTLLFSQSHPDAYKNHLQKGSQ